jgi:acyl carrier protein
MFARRYIRTNSVRFVCNGALRRGDFECRRAAKPRLRKRIAAISPATWQNFFEQLWCYCNTLKTFTERHIVGRIAWSHRKRIPRVGGPIMTIAGLTSSDQATTIKAAFAANDVRTLIANHLGVSIGRVTDDAHFTHDLGADWLDRLELMVAVEDQFVGVEITDDAVDRIELVGDLIRHIETMDSERRRRGAAPVFSKLFGPHLARAMKPITQQEGGEQVALFFLRLAGEAMRTLIGWCPETRQPIDLQIYVDDATLTRIWSNVVRFQCPHCGTKHETKVERLASRPLSLEPPQTQRTRHQHTALVGSMQSR